jgi:hypothetical protein
MQVTDILQLLQEGAFIHIPLGTIHPREPPTLVHPDGYARRDRIFGVVGVENRDPRRLPSQQDPANPIRKGRFYLDPRPILALIPGGRGKSSIIRAKIRILAQHALKAELGLMSRVKR